jgi:hypothetical protein
MLTISQIDFCFCSRIECKISLWKRETDEQTLSFRVYIQQFEREASVFLMMGKVFPSIKFNDELELKIEVETFSLQNQLFYVPFTKQA